MPSLVGSHPLFRSPELSGAWAGSSRRENQLSITASTIKAESATNKRVDRACAPMRRVRAATHQVVRCFIGPWAADPTGYSHAIHQSRVAVEPNALGDCPH